MLVTINSEKINFHPIIDLEEENIETKHENPLEIEENLEWHVKRRNNNENLCNFYNNFIIINWYLSNVTIK
ncbi:hypothetical protein ES703_125118 [subsurface metagenome]